MSNFLKKLVEMCRKKKREYKKYKINNKYKVTELAKYIVQESTKNELWISNTQLNYFLFILQCYYISDKHETLFDNDFIVKPYGIIIPDAFNYFIGFGSMELFYIYPDYDYLEYFSKEDLEYISDLFRQEYHNITFHGIYTIVKQYKEIFGDKDKLPNKDLIDIIKNKENWREEGIF